MKRSEALATPDTPEKRLRVLTADLKRLQVKLLHGGGPDKVAKQHEADKLTARERIDLLIDKDS